ncbi:MAG: DUF4364 family protein [Clostridia bacterium]|nr:DUF4364 family protein [Clostridia bacterium]
MGSMIGSMKNVKIFVLYLMENVGTPLSFVTLNDIVMQTDYIMYLDFAEAFHKMLDDDLICEAGEGEEGDPVFEITDKGRCVAESLHSEILSSILDKSLAAALRYLDFKKRGIEGHCEISRRDDGRYTFTCSLSEQGEQIYSTMLVVDSLDRAVRLKENFHDRPEVIYRGVHALLAGNMNFLFDD